MQISVEGILNSIRETRKGDLRAAVAARAVRSWSGEDWQRELEPAEGTDHVQAVAGRLREHGLVHAGPGTIARLLARTGMTPGHLDGCFRC